MGEGASGHKRALCRGGLLGGVGRAHAFFGFAVRYAKVRADPYWQDARAQRRGNDHPYQRSKAPRSRLHRVASATSRWLTVSALGSKNVTCHELEVSFLRLGAAVVEKKSHRTRPEWTARSPRRQASC